MTPNAQLADYFATAASNEPAGTWPMTKLSISVAAVMLMAAVAGAQTPRRPPTVSEVRAGLQSSSRLEVAWAMFSAGEHGYTEVVPDLLPFLETLPPTTTFKDKEQRTLVALLLDALIQLHASVPATSVAPYFKQWPVQTRVLLGNASGPDPALLDILRDTAGKSWEAWVATANLLLRSRPPGFAARLLDRVRLELMIHVFDRQLDGATEGMGSGGGIGVGMGDVDNSEPADFPPHAEYKFAILAGSGAVVLAEGPSTAYYVRHVTRHFPTSWSRSFGPGAYQRLTYVAALMPGVPVPPVNSSVNIKWRNASDFRRRVGAARTAVEQGYTQMLDELVVRHLLTSEEATQHQATIRLELQDLRTNRAAKLPDVGAN